MFLSFNFSMLHCVGFKIIKLSAIDQSAIDYGSIIFEEQFYKLTLCFK